MLARALPESASHKAATPQGLPSFRFHGFIRNVEGLFGSVDVGKRGHQDRRSDDRARRLARQADRRFRARPPALRAPVLRSLRRASARRTARDRAPATPTSSEMLPSAADLESIPEKAGSEYYDKMTWAAVRGLLAEDGDAAEIRAQLRSLDEGRARPEHGAVTERDDVPAGHIGGHIYFQTDDAITNCRRAGRSA